MTRFRPRSDGLDAARGIAFALLLELAVFGALATPFVLLWLYLSSQ